MQVNLNAITHKKFRLRNGLDGIIDSVSLHSTHERMPVYKVSFITSKGSSFITFYFQNGCCYNPNTSDLDMLYVIQSKRKSMEDL